MRPLPHDAEPGLIETRIVFGGVTEKGYEVAKRLCAEWAADGHRSIWFDGWAWEPVRPVAAGANVTVVSYAGREMARWSSRLERSAAGRAEESTGWSAVVWSAIARLARKWNTATRGYGSWRTIKDDVRALTNLRPTRIVYCDDHAMTAAWHAARIWPEAVVMRG